MIPIRDSIPTRRVPIVNYALIGANLLVFLLMWLAGPEQERLVYQFALIPASFSNGIDLGDITDIFTSMFMHAGLAHIAGNMLYLWIFGDNVEDRLGSFKYLLFYLAGGLAASLTHLLFNPNSQIPTVGASGAIAAVLGAYLVMYPQSRIATFIPLGFFMRLAMVPASVVLGFWFILQLFNGFLSIGAADVGGVAFWAHIGGFVAGVVLAKLMPAPRPSASVITW
ncbi:MAG TPA: rhomboid family intramembrane serine protease [Anaerolineaceae bacterium]|nr:rhomboid family intramembrane serine protease [Longilinea sp.]HNS37965.1 rhomboid family intramembrane serine protease [Anaerolineaceae bacterium]HNZ12274.1 rhomboid family intramembrane serine protease [Anaerolineaceae bacterium]HOG78714.1 rhomboid family intramembrane serine protease [Anaerolineaceae bacterium]HQF62734.1 rhomboid family intramembrane serine protease [Anaerolineaceae bacterium]